MIKQFTISLFIIVGLIGILILMISQTLLLPNDISMILISISSAFIGASITGFLVSQIVANEQRSISFKILDEIRDNSFSVREMIRTSQKKNIFNNFREAISSLEEIIEREDKSIFFIGSTLRWLQYEESIVSLLKKKNEESCDIKVILMNPNYAPERERQENRAPKALEFELKESIQFLNRLGVSVRIINSPLSYSAILTRNYLMMSPSLFNEETFRSVFFLIDKEESSNSSKMFTVFERDLQNTWDLSFQLESKQLKSFLENDS